jgi:hypothetical protein
MSGIRLSPKHGVNPSLLVCFACGDDSGGIALLGRIRKPTATPGRPTIHRDDDDFDAQAPRYMRDTGLCPRCTEAVASGGVILIEVREQPKRPAYEGGAGETLDPKEAEQIRTGRMWAIKGEAFARIFNEAPPAKRLVFIGSDAAALIFGKPGEKKEPT